MGFRPFVFRKIAAIAIPLGIAIVLVLFCWKLRVMSAELLLYISAGAQVFSSFLGAIVSLSPDFSKRQKIGVLASFAMLGIIGAYATIQQSARSSKDTSEANTKLGLSIDALRASSEESARLTRLNSQLQGNLIDSSRQLASLTRKNYSIVSGGHSFCYVDMHYGGGPRNILQVALLGKGPDPIPWVSGRIVDLDSFLKTGALAETEIHFEFQTPRRFTGLYTQLNRSVSVNPDTPSKQYNVFLQASNGMFTQLLRLRKVDAAWMSATRVSGFYYGGDSWALVHEEIDKGFPVDVLATDTGWKDMDKLKRITIK